VNAMMLIELKSIAHLLQLLKNSFAISNRWVP
jgi:hypothetical protein